MRKIHTFCVQIALMGQLLNLLSELFRRTPIIGQFLFHSIRIETAYPIGKCGTPHSANHFDKWQFQLCDVLCRYSQLKLSRLIKLGSKMRDFCLLLFPYKIWSDEHPN